MNEGRSLGILRLRACDSLAALLGELTYPVGELTYPDAKAARNAS